MNYPNGIKKEVKISHSNRGMSLEDDINITNKYYKTMDIALIYKKPTSIQIVKIINNVIKEGYFKVPSTTDYNGIYCGNYIDFEVKEVSNNSFPLSNIKDNQLTHLINVIKHGGISFIIVRFIMYDCDYLLETKHIIDFIKLNKRKSIPQSYFLKYGYLIKSNYNARVDYIEVIKRIRSRNEKIYEKI